jgi:hypothetical protein
MLDHALQFPSLQNHEPTEPLLCKLASLKYVVIATEKKTKTKFQVATDTECHLANQSIKLSVL